MAAPRAVCPRCLVRPARFTNRYRGRTPLCITCHAKAVLHRQANRAHRDDYVYTRHQDRPQHAFVDLPAEEIERRYQAALKQIRQRGSGL